MDRDNNRRLNHAHQRWVMDRALPLRDDKQEMRAGYGLTWLEKEAVSFYLDKETETIVQPVIAEAQRRAQVGGQRAGTGQEWDRPVPARQHLNAKTVQSQLVTGAN